MQCVCRDCRDVVVLADILQIYLNRRTKKMGSIILKQKIYTQAITLMKLNESKDEWRRGDCQIM